MTPSVNSSFKPGVQCSLLAFAPIAAIFFIIPFELYFNGKEYWNYSIPIGFALFGILMYLLLVSIIWVCSKIQSQLPLYVSTSLFCLGVFVLFADIFSPLQTNLLDGSELTSGEPLTYTLIEAALLFAIMAVVAKLGLRSTVSLAVPVSLLFLVVSLGYFGLVVASSKRVSATSSNQRRPNANIRGNVYHIVLDEMQTDAAVLYLYEERGEKVFSGFTVYQNNISNYMYTNSSMPSYLTGTLYAEGSFTDWRERPNEEGLFKDLYDKGYDGTMYAPDSEWCNPHLSKCVTLTDIYEEHTGLSHTAHIKDFIQIWMARVMPNVLTNEALAAGRRLGQFAYAFVEGSEKVPATITEGGMPFSSVLMLKQLIDMEKTRPPNGQYVYAHAMLPHGPFVMSHDCKDYDLKFRNTGIDGYYAQVSCAFSLVAEFMDELKHLGRYDESTIVIHGDTGHGHLGFINKVNSKLVGLKKGGDAFLPHLIGWTKEQLLARTMTLLMIKPAHSSGDLAFSERLSQLIDLYPTMVDLLELHPAKTRSEGVSLLQDEYPETREANFFMYPVNELEPDDVMIINISDQRNLSKSELTISGYINDFVPIDFPADGVTIDIGSSKEGRLRLIGFSGRERDASHTLVYRWAMGKDSSMIFRGLRPPTTSRMLLTFEAAPFVVNLGKEMTIQSPLSTTKVLLKPGWNEYSAILKFPGGVDPTLDIHYENTASPHSLDEIYKDMRDLSVRWSRVSLRYASDAHER